MAAFVPPSLRLSSPLVKIGGIRLRLNKSATVNNGISRRLLLNRSRARIIPRLIDPNGSSSHVAAIVRSG